MDKQTVDNYLEFAYNAIKTAGIEEKGKVKKSYRSQISAFGASISMGSVRAAIAFFSSQGGSDTNRPKLLYAIYLVLKDAGVIKTKLPNDNGKKENEAANVLFKELGKKSINKSDIVNATIAIKLAINLYVLDEKN